MCSFKGSLQPIHGLYPAQRAQGVHDPLALCRHIESYFTQTNNALVLCREKCPILQTRPLPEHHMDTNLAEKSPFEKQNDKN